VSLAAVKRFHVTEAVLSDTERALCEAGEDGYELFVLWTGRTLVDSFMVDRSYVPRQQSYKTHDGLCVRIEAEELHRLNIWLFKEKQVLGVQVHTHPGRAYHSDTDNAFPIVTALGGASIVVPDFCDRGLAAPGTVVYRLTAVGWEELDRAAAYTLIPSLRST
jgi:hypothetical protein